MINVGIVGGTGDQYLELSAIADSTGVAAGRANWFQVVTTAEEFVRPSSSGTVEVC